jgi:hypothetical protein
MIPRHCLLLRTTSYTLSPLLQPLNLHPNPTLLVIACTWQVVSKAASHLPRQRQLIVCCCVPLLPTYFNRWCHMRCCIQILPCCLHLLQSIACTCQVIGKAVPIRYGSGGSVLAVLVNDVVTLPAPSSSSSSASAAGSVRFLQQFGMATQLQQPNASSNASQPWDGIIVSRVRLRSLKCSTLFAVMHLW